MNVGRATGNSSCSSEEAMNKPMPTPRDESTALAETALNEASSAFSESEAHLRTVQEAVAEMEEPAA